MYDLDTIKDLLCNKYTAAELVEELSLTPEELYDMITDTILENLEVFNLLYDDIYGEDLKDEDTDYTVDKELDG